ncbi:MAG: hypothetical protein M0R31_05725 [Candidatus Riflebacteria bacterium]|nr:hypothetical protein [Candidatus Riflebacteria bacterium]
MLFAVVKQRIQLECEFHRSEGTISEISEFVGARDVPLGKLVLCERKL